jgi:gamma-F420-2:alpha-L-glutamate ligase
MIDGWLVYNREDYEKNRAFADMFPPEGQKHGLDIKLKFRDEICASLSEGKLLAGCSKDSIPAFVINRSRDWLLGSMLEQAGCRVFNSSEATCIGNDKMQSHLLAARLGIPQVDMAFCENKPGCLARHGLDYPIVLKSPYGHGGSEVFLAHDEAELFALAAALPCGKVIIQRLCGRPGADVRVYALGGKILAAVRRTSPADFRANLSLGGSVELYILGQSEIEMVNRILLTLQPDFAGIDFIFDAEGHLLFNEIEDAVGSRSLYRLGGFDVVGLYLDHIASVMK